MIKEEFVKVKVTSSMIKYYQDKGYECECNSQILVKPLDLPTFSRIKVTAICDNPKCNNDDIIELPYVSYSRSTQNSMIPYYCKKCIPVRQLEIAIEKMKLGLLNRNDYYYWNIKENRINELHKYIGIYGHINGIRKRDGALYSVILKHDGNFTQFVEECGYNLSELAEKYKIEKKNLSIVNQSKDDILLSVNKFIEEHKRFPRQMDFDALIPYSYSRIQTLWGGLENLRKELNYTNTMDLVDNRGDMCRSLLEVHVVNWVISQGLKDKYLKEQYPFPKEEGHWRSDIAFYPEGKNPIHIEIWGYPITGKSTDAIRYNEKRKIKETLYKKYEDDITLVSINFEDVHCNFEIMNDNLYNILSPYISLNLQKIEWNNIKSYSEFSDDETLQELLSVGNGQFPSFKELNTTIQGRALYTFVINRFGGLCYFMNKYNISDGNLTNKFKYWDVDKIFETFEYMLNTYDRIISTTESDEMGNLDMKLKGFKGQVLRLGGCREIKLQYYKLCLDNNKMKKYYVLFKQDIAVNYKPIRKDLDEETKQLAQELLARLDTIIKTIPE